MCGPTFTILPVIIMSPDYTLKNTNFKHRFDFEIGWLVKSPCKVCETRIDFPECLDTCARLSEIHQILAESINCSQRA